MIFSPLSWPIDVSFYSMCPIGPHKERMIRYLCHHSMILKFYTIVFLFCLRLRKSKLFSFWVPKYKCSGFIGSITVLFQSLSIKSSRGGAITHESHYYLDEK